MSHSHIRKEARYGIPAADHILYNRHHIIGYSYYFRQAKWALEIVDNTNSEVKRKNVFRPDYRIPENFRADLVDFVGSGFDRGHLVASANQIGLQIQNSETFLLSNMAPQHPDLNQRIWRQLEEDIRTLSKRKTILETYVICGPIFYFDQPVQEIGGTEDQTSVPVPNAFFKSVLIESHTGRLQMWTFRFPNEKCDLAISEYQVPTTKIEKYTGIKLWESLIGRKIDTEKKRIRKYWIKD